LIQLVRGITPALPTIINTIIIITRKTQSKNTKGRQQ